MGIFLYMNNVVYPVGEWLVNWCKKTLYSLYIPSPCVMSSAFFQVYNYLLDMVMSEEIRIFITLYTVVVNDGKYPNLT